MTTASKRVVALLASTTLLAAGCTRFTEEARPTAAPDLVAAAKSGELKCEPVDAPLTDVPRVDLDEPTIRIPTPSGWGKVQGKDDDLVRFTMVNPDLSAMGIPAMAGALLESVPNAMDPEAVFASERKGIEQTGVPASSMKVTDHKVCGLPAQTVEYPMPAMPGVPAHPAVAVLVAYQTKVRTYCAGLTVQGPPTDHATLDRDTDMIIRGFQVFSPPPAPPK